MSFIDDVADVGSSIISGLSGNGLGPMLARTALAGFALNQITKSMNKDNATPGTVDQGVRLQLDPNTANAIPVVYGTATIGGKLVDAQIANNNKTMWYCLALCEKTGALLSTNQASVISLRDVYWDQQKIMFANDGVTLASLVDSVGNVNSGPAGLVKVYFFSGSSQAPTKLNNAIAGNAEPAWNLMPGWTSSHMMNGLVFALVRVDYSKEQNITGLGNVEFTLNNTMTLPGDCLYDYMSNEIYGAGISPAEINT